MFCLCFVICLLFRYEENLGIAFLASLLFWMKCDYITNSFPLFEFWGFWVFFNHQTELKKH